MFLHEKYVRMQGILKKKPEEEMAWDIYRHRKNGEVQMAEKMLSYVRNELVPGIAVSGRRILGACAAGGCVAAELDDLGHLSYSTEQILRVFEKNAPYLNRAYLHSAVHCISPIRIAEPRQAAVESRL